MNFIRRFTFACLVLFAHDSVHSSESQLPTLQLSPGVATIPLPILTTNPTSQESSLFAAFHGNEHPLYLTTVGFDIDYDNEVEILLNNKTIGHFSRGPNNKSNSGDSFFISASEQKSGQNLIEFRQSIKGGIWGVQRILLEPIDTHTQNAQPTSDFLPCHPSSQHVSNRTNLSFYPRSITAWEETRYLTLSSSQNGDSEYEITISEDGINWLSATRVKGERLCPGDVIKLSFNSTNLKPGSHIANVYIMVNGSKAAELQVNHIIPKPRIAVSEWDRADVRLNGYSLGVDDDDKRLFHAIGHEYDIEHSYSATLSYDSDADYEIRLNNSEVIPDGYHLDFGQVSYATNTNQLQLYQHNKLIHEYTLVHTNLPVVAMKALHVASGAKLPGLIQMISPPHGMNTPFFNMGIEFRGNTARTYPKKPFNVELRTNMELKNTDTTDFAYFGMRNDDDWILDAAYRDTSFARNIVSLAIWDDMQQHAYLDNDNKPKGQPSPRGDLVEVILDNQYQGVHLMHERVDRKLLGLKKGADSVLYKAMDASAELSLSPSLIEDFDQKYPDVEKIERWHPLQELARFIDESTDEEFVSGIPDHVDIDNVVDFVLLALVTGSTDTLRKNYFLYRNEAGKFHITPWDFDATFGMGWDGSLDKKSDVFWFKNRNRLLDRLSDLTNTGFNKKLKKRWAELRNNLFTIDSLSKRFELYAQQLQPIAGSENNAFERNLSRWPDSGGKGKVHPELGQVEWIKSWISKRLSWLDSEILLLAE